MFSICVWKLYQRRPIKQSLIRSICWCWDSSGCSKFILIILMTKKLMSISISMSIATSKTVLSIVSIGLFVWGFCNHMSISLLNSFSSKSTLVKSLKLRRSPSICWIKRTSGSPGLPSKSSSHSLTWKIILFIMSGFLLRRTWKSTQM